MTALVRFVLAMALAAPVSALAQAAEPAPAATAAPAPASEPTPAPAPASEPGPAPAPASEPAPAPGPAPTPAPAPAPAAEPSPVPPPPPGYDVERIVAEHEAAEERLTMHRHDGFYLRFGLTMGYVTDSASFGGIETTSHGGGGFIDYAIGGTLGEGFVLAFGHHTIGVFSPTTESDGAELGIDHTLLVQVLGIMLDYFPDPTGGLHFAPTIGFGSAHILYDNRDDRSDGTGFGLGLAVGYDFWVGEQWSLGAAGQVLYVNGAEDAFGNHDALAPMVVLSALYH